MSIEPLVISLDFNDGLTFKTENLLTPIVIKLCTFNAAQNVAKH